MTTSNPPASPAVRAFLDGIGGMSRLRFYVNCERFAASGVIVPLVTNQADADELIPPALASKKLRVVWAELRGAVDFTPWLPIKVRDECTFFKGVPSLPSMGKTYPRKVAPDWLILSGSPDSPTDLAWLRRVIADCRAAGVPCRVRNIGARPYDGLTADGETNDLLAYERGVFRAVNPLDPRDIPAEFRVFEVPKCLEVA